MRALRVALFALAAVAMATPAMAASFRVDSLIEDSDARPGDGICATAGGACTIRAALEEAEALAQPTEILRPVLGRPGKLRALRGPNGRPITGGSRAPILTFTVDTIDDAVDAAPGDGTCATATGTCSLRAAVQEANDLEGAQSIVVPEGHFILTIAATNDDSAQEGDLDIVDELVITGAGAALTTLDAGDVDRVFDNFHLLTLSAVHLVGGDPEAIATDFGSLALSDGLFTDNLVGINGCSGKMTIARCHFEKNALAAAQISTCAEFSMEDTTVERNGHGFGFDRVTGTLKRVAFRENDGDGVGVFVQNRLTLRNATISENGNGLVHRGFDFSNFVTVEESSITDNLGDGATYTDGTLAILNSRVAENGGCGVRINGQDGGALTLRNAVVSHNGCGVEINGGRVVVGAVIELSQIVDNDGIGLAASASASLVSTLDVIDTTIARNAGGGVSVFGVNGNGIDVAISRTTISDNTADRGAGLRVFRSQDYRSNVRMLNSTVSRNIGSTGNGILNEGGDLDLRNVTVTGELLTLDDSITTARNTILANGCAGDLTSAGYNVFGTLGACNVTGDETGNVVGPPLLGELSTNGGPSTTRALLPGSPAREAGNPNGCVDADDLPLTTDQRGVPRPQGTRCDIGAFEATCGDGDLDSGETCDDGNNADGDCCSDICQLESEGAACSDGNTCSTGDRCVAGTCTPTGEQRCGPCLSCLPEGGCIAEPWTGCHQPTESLSGELEIVAKPNRRSIEWSWVEGEATSRDELGNPLADDRYSFCLYDESAAAPRIAFAATTRTDPCGKRSCWKPTGKTGFQYSAPTSDLLRKVVLKSGTEGKAKVLVTAKGDQLVLPTLPMTLPLRAQVQAENGQCWESEFDTRGVKKNDAKHFRAKASLP
jgi:CSLREA domain-containing protein